uniref:Ig-like domain-containing protein n=1 Tax=Knipowitschia caucasica TaxID=637954 RepID=A0AAV2KUV4_KNICA
MSALLSVGFGQGSLRPRHPSVDSGHEAYNSYSYSQSTAVTEWTSWFNIDHPGGNGDYERLEAIRFYYRERVCVRPTAMEVRTTDWVSAADTGEVVHSSLDKGFWCVNKEQPHGRICSNYHVRFQCPPVQSYWSDWSEWGPCSTSVCNDAGIQTRHRKCLSSQPMPLLLVPACQGHHTDRRECSTPPCTAKWSPWGQWGDCSVSCGGGRRVRRRTCIKNSPTVQCTGRPAEMQKCGKSPCPVRCQMSCSEGRPIEDCSRCVCDGHVLLGEVHSMTGVPVSGASVSLPSQPKVILARTDNKGQFKLPGVCSSSSALVSIRKDKFAPVTVAATSNTTGRSWIKTVLKTAEKPYIVKHPEDKVRYEGGRVLLCCKATGSPLPDKYYWYHNGTLLDRKVNKYEEDLVLRDLRPEQSGHYYCKTSSSAGSIKSAPALLTVIAKGAAACNSSPEPHLVRMPVDCVQPGTDSAFYNAGRCPHNKCPGPLDYDLRCRDGAGFCCAVKTMEARTINCGSYNQNPRVAKEIAIGRCFDGTSDGFSREMKADAGIALTFHCPERKINREGLFQRLQTNPGQTLAQMARDMRELEGVQVQRSRVVAYPGSKYYFIDLESRVIVDNLMLLSMNHF